MRRDAFSTLVGADDRPRFYMRLADGERPIRWKASPCGPEQAVADPTEAFRAAGIGAGEAVIIWKGTVNG